MGIGPTICQPPTPSKEITYEYNAVLCFYHHAVDICPWIYFMPTCITNMYNKIKQKIRLCNITLEFGFGWVAVFELTELHQQISMSLNEFHLLNSQAKIFFFFSSSIDVQNIIQVGIRQVYDRNVTESFRLSRSTIRIFTQNKKLFFLSSRSNIRLSRKKNIKFFQKQALHHGLDEI